MSDTPELQLCIVDSLVSDDNSSSIIYQLVLNNSDLKVYESHFAMTSLVQKTMLVYKYQVNRVLDGKKMLVHNSHLRLSI